MACTKSFSIGTVLLLSMLMVSAATHPRSAPPEGFRQAGEMLMKYMNASADPCEDFYSYACGGWKAAHPISPNETRVWPSTILVGIVRDQKRILLESTSDLSSSKAIRMARDLYRKCMDNEESGSNGQGVVNRIKKMGAWPMIGHEWKPTDYNLTDLLIKSTSRKGSLFFKTETRKSFNGSENILHVVSKNLLLSPDYYLFHRPLSEKAVEAYKQYLFDKVSLIAEYFGNAVPTDSLKTDIEDIYELEQQIAILLFSENNPHLAHLFFNLTAVVVGNETAVNNTSPEMSGSSSFQYSCREVEWQRFFESVAPSEVQPLLASNTRVGSENFVFSNICRLFSVMDPRVVTNYLFLRYTESFFELFSDHRFKEILQRFFKTYKGLEKLSEPWEHCVWLVETGMGHAMARLYNEKHVDAETMEMIGEMVDDFFNVFEDILRENSWMDDKTKKAAMSKLAMMQGIVGNPEWILKDDKLDDYYRDLNFKTSDSFADMMEKLDRWSINLEYLKLLKPVDRNEFMEDPSQYQAGYYPRLNAFFLSAELLQPPILQKTYPMSLNFGTIGSTIGHEITHGFDNQGRKFDGEGNYMNWWDEESENEFKNRAQCFIDQYSAIEVELVGGNLDGNTLLQENIADNGGLKLAYMAYKRFIKKHGEEPKTPMKPHLSNEQLFFVGYAQSFCSEVVPEELLFLLTIDTHTPHQYRATAALANHPAFAEVFKCPKNSKMNPERRCAVW